ncbi:MAG TPA: threonine--tRNA ligase [Spirochaetota bacterium]|nr:threonine--tRNA ligase [Spirochaetota bacterium]HPN13445.1 threonine--tRNA ligase [Spirochaetota bacterium]
MGNLTITLPDSSTLQVPEGRTAFEAIGAISPRLQKAALAVAIDGVLADCSRVLDRDAALRVITFDSPEGKDVLWHSASHLMAQAVKRLFPGAKFAIGPSIETGFYYDIDVSAAFTPEDLARIEEEMGTIAAEDLEIRREDIPRADALKLFSDAGETYKVEMIGELKDDAVSIYRQGEFFDFCRGPHVPRTSYVKAFKLLSIAGAYWRGSEKNKMLQRIYGIAFPDKKLLAAHLEFLEEAKRRDHRRLGKELDLFSIHDETGAGLVLWHPKGACLKNIIEDFWRKEHFKNGYDLVGTPHIGKSQLWETSGHLGFYTENMYSPMDIDGQPYYVKPMNCPFHIMIYMNKGWSYRELPLRWAELGTVYRYERSGVLHGLLRVRGFTQDDAHLFCRPDQMPDEIDRVLAFCLFMLREFGFKDFKVYLATRPAEKSVGDESMWQEAIKALEASVNRAGIEYELDEGGGAFYGPKIDIKIKDVLAREWQCSTIQFDFNLPERFDLTYVDTDGKKHRPYMIHRALLGSLERFLGVLVEHYGGRFPVWLSPVQAVLINVSDEEAGAVEQLSRRMVAEGLRPGMDRREETMGYRVRDAIAQKVPYIGVIGKKEVANGMVSVRKRGEDKSAPMKIEELIQLIKDDAANHR